MQTYFFDFNELVYEVEAENEKQARELALQDVLEDARHSLFLLDEDEIQARGLTD